MTPKEKAQELINKYLAVQFGDFSTTDAKRCALIAIDEMLNFWDNLFITEGSLVYKYLLEVKQEINNL